MTQKHTAPWFIAAMVCIGGFNAAHAAVITTAAGNGADTYINQSAATTNYGSDTALALKNNTDSFDRKIYLRFDLSSISATIDSAVLQLHLASLAGSRTFTLYGLHERDGSNVDINDNWSETGLHWTNAPANDPSASFTSDATLLATASASSGSNVTLVFNDPAIITFLNADEDGLVTFMLHRTNNNASIDSFDSKENTTVGAIAPTLTLTTIPEPTSLALLGLAALTLISQGKRRL